MPEPANTTVPNQPAVATPTPPTPPAADQTTGREPSTAELRLLGLDTDAVESGDKTELSDNPDDASTPAAKSFVEKALDIAKKPGRTPRNFEGLDDTEKEIFDNMNRPAYERLYPLYAKLKQAGYTTAEAVDGIASMKQELESLKASKQPQTYFDSPEAYLLDESYRNTLLEQNQAGSQVTYWTDQLAKCRANQPFNGLVRGNDGTLTADGTFEPTPQAEARLMSLISGAQQEQMQANGKLIQISQTYKQSYQDYVDKITAAHNNVFGPFEAHLKDDAAKELEMFPEFVRGRPEVKSLAYSYALLKKVVEGQKATRQQEQAAEFTQKAAKQAGPRQPTVKSSPKPAADPKAQEEDYRLFKQKFQVA